MANPSIAQNTIPVKDLSLKDLLDIFKKDIFQTFNCHAIATVETVDYTRQVLTATINYSSTYFKKTSPTSNDLSAVLVDYPPLVDCPFVILGGGGAGLTFPIKAKDQCVILFNDRDLDNWYAGATSGACSSPRMHSMSDPIALVGLRSGLTIDPLRAVLNGPGAAKVGVSATKVLITNGTTLFNLINQLITDLKNLTIDVTGVTPGSGSAVGTVDPSSQAALGADATALGNLIE